MGHERFFQSRAAQLALEVQLGRQFQADAEASDGAPNEGLIRAAAVAAAALPGPPVSLPEKWAFTAVLQLPLYDILRYVQETVMSEHKAECILPTFIYILCFSQQN